MQADGLILAGGKSSRMGGEHKGNLIYGGETFTQILVKELNRGTYRECMTVVRSCRISMQTADL